MSVVSDQVGDSPADKPRRLVSLRRDKEDFVVVVEDVVMFRNGDASALRKVCDFLRWKIISDTSLSIEDL
jgi:hypothetical protein